MPAAAAKRYWDYLEQTFPECVCGKPREAFHHIIHLNYQRITKDPFLIIGLCWECHQGRRGVHSLGGEQQYRENVGYDLVQISVLRRHDYEVRHG